MRCRAPFAAEVLESNDGVAYRLAPQMDRLLLDQDFPGWVGGIFNIMIQPELFDRFSASLASWQRTWWDQVSPEFIAALAGTSHPFYSRLLASGITRVPGLAERLEAGAHVLELACGTARGLTRLAHAYPQSSFVAHDGDAYSLELASEGFRDAGLHDRISVLHRSIEDLDQDDAYDVALINVSMHECRDIERATASIHRALKPGGTFVISYFPFPDSHEGLRTPPARVMRGIQFFEALIDDQLLPTGAYVELLGRHGFADIASLDLSPVHVVIHGQK